METELVIWDMGDGYTVQLTYKIQEMAQAPFDLGEQLIANSSGEVEYLDIDRLLKMWFKRYRSWKS